MLYAVLALIAGLVLLVWALDRFIDGASPPARRFGMSPLLVGMVIVGFNTSAPKWWFRCWRPGQQPRHRLGQRLWLQHHQHRADSGRNGAHQPHCRAKADCAHRNAHAAGRYAGGMAALGWHAEPDRWHRAAGDAGGVHDVDDLEKPEGTEQLAAEYAENWTKHAPAPLYKSIFWLVLGLVLLVLSSRLLVWGAVTIAKSLGVSDLIIGLTVVAIGTSLPELASSIAAAQRRA